MLDDPFSAVDAHTGSHLFKEVLLGLLSSKTVIYVTHQVEFLPAADLILVMKDGKITQAGKYSDILNSGTDFMELAQWQVFIVFVPVIALCIWYQQYYIPSARELSRLLGSLYPRDPSVQQLRAWREPPLVIEENRPDRSWPSIGEVGIHDLQVRYAPQMPLVLRGTVRSNLDPLEEYADEQIWEALDKCQLGDEVRKKEGKLDSRVDENGENWSMGQRQLVCLGRVLLKKSKVLVLDEATASVDTATDNLIQQTLRQHFSHCTVITIAHRITSVLDSDMVLLLSHGLIEEYDSPTKLLENKSSSFAQLVAEYSVRSKSSFEN
ncbi:hypothetical protein Q3G72_010637 [Acer saccharum]|nr:hypothetical protein Q3G72_010637 [Acer saccharum]